MNQQSSEKKCLSCGRSEYQIPLVTLRYSENPAFICSFCLPLLIHHPEQLIGKLKGAENIPPAEHND
jgi:hypothetical protein